MWEGGCGREGGEGGCKREGVEGREGGREGGGRVWKRGLVNICDYVQAQLN